MSCHLSSDKRFCNKGMLEVRRALLKEIQTIRVSTISFLAKDFCSKYIPEVRRYFSGDLSEHNLVVGKRFCNKGMLEV